MLAPESQTTATLSVRSIAHEEADAQVLRQPQGVQDGNPHEPVYSGGGHSFMHVSHSENAAVGVPTCVP